MRNVIPAVIVALLVVGCGKAGSSSTGVPAPGEETPGGPQHLFEGSCDLLGKPFGGGSGTVINPYLICSAAQLLNVSDTQYAAASFQLYKSLDLTDAPQMMFSDFAGTFDGNYKTLSNLSGAGLFDKSSGTIKNLTITGAKVFGSYRAGILVGWNQPSGQVMNCHVDGEISTSYHTGGLVGFNEGTITGSSANVTASGADHIGGFVGVNKGTISKSWSRGAVTAAFDVVGGFVGDNYQGSISDSYSLASANGRNNVGGFFGTNEAGIVNAYSMGAVAGTGLAVGGFGATNTGTVSASHWDTETSGKATSAAGTGHVSVDMKAIGTYTGWDFAAVWDIAASYPTLR